MATKIPQTILNNVPKILEELSPVDKGTYFLLTCPSCGHKETFIYKGSDVIICNRRNKCSYISSIYDYIKETNDLSDKEVLPYLINSMGKAVSYIEVIKEEAQLEVPENVEFFSINKSGMIRDIAYNYLANRGIPKSNIEELGYIIDPNEEYDKSIFIPFYEDGVMVYFVCRSFLDNAVKRYNNPHGINSKKYIYNYDKIKNEVFIFEGIMDALSLDTQVGTAMLSSDLGREQAIKILSKAPKTLIFVPDNDEAGRQSLYKNIKIMLKYKPPSLDINMMIYFIRKGKDFNESGKHHIDINKCEKVKKIELMRT